MKTVKFRSIFLIVFGLFLASSAIGQKGIEDGSKYGHGQDSINCLMNLSLYKEFFKHGNYNDAIKSWRKVFNECPASSQNLYVDGVKMYKKFVSSEKNPDKVNAYIDTIMLIYDRRMEYFNDEANVLSRKATDLLRYKNDDIVSVEKAYKDLKKSIELDKKEARDATIILFVNSSVSLNKSGKVNQDQCIEDYFMASEIIEMNLATDPSDKRWLNAKESVDEFVIEANVLTCEALNDYFAPKFDAHKTEEAFLNRMVEFYYSTGCDRADLYAAALEALYGINPDHKSAYKLARLFVAKEQYDKATQYYLEAVGGDAENEDRAQYYYELAQVTRVLGQACKAIEYGRESVKLDPNKGDAYILLGDCYIESRETLGDDFEQRTAFWAAADKYIKAKNVDPTVSDDANKRINDYAGQYPDSEQCFFRSLKEGDSYQLKGCINEYTTVRPRK